MIEGKIIDYPSAPTGKAYIGVAKEPLMPNKNGHGFEGVLLQSEDRTQVQCSECGGWFGRISMLHLRKCSTLQSAEEYKQKYGLFLTKALMSDKVRLGFVDRMIENKANGWVKQKYSAKPVDAEARARSVETRKKNNQSREHQNLHGSCPEQLKARLKEFILVNKELPSTYNSGVRLRHALWRKFGTMNKALEHYGLPTRHKRGTAWIYYFKNGDTHELNINLFPDREVLFEKMLATSDLFKQDEQNINQ